MLWLLGSLVLVAVGAALRRLLHLDAGLALPHRLVPLDPQRQAIYQPVTLEMETRAAILGISLNDAFEERDWGRPEIAWRLVELSVGEWNRLGQLIEALLKVLAHYLPRSQVVVFHSMVAHLFKSGTMVNYLRMHELLDQLVFGSSLRFQLHLRLLRRASETLSTEFRRRYRYTRRTGEIPGELWSQLDLYFHDFDLVAKEALLALRALMLCLPQEALPELEADLRSLIGQGVRSTIGAVVDRCR